MISSMDLQVKHLSLLKSEHATIMPLIGQDFQIRKDPELEPFNWGCRHNQAFKLPTSSKQVVHSKAAQEKERQSFLVLLCWLFTPILKPHLHTQHLFQTADGLKTAGTGGQRKIHRSAYCPLSMSWFLDLSTTDILGRGILWLGGCPEHCGGV